MVSSDITIVRATLRLISSAKRYLPEYGESDRPVDDAAMSRLLQGFGVHLEIFPFRSSAIAMGVPRYGEKYPIFINRRSPREQRMYALRHALAHVIAGETEHIVLNQNLGYMTDSERIADLFALYDLVPNGEINSWLTQITSPQIIQGEVLAAIDPFATDGSVDWLADRARLRLALFRLNLNL